MKTHVHTGILFALLAALAPLTSQAQTTFFSDNFNAGSTIDNTTPSPFPPTTHSTAYQQLSDKPWNITPSISPNDLSFGMAATGGGIDEIQAMFASDPVVLSAVGSDYIQLTIVFTNTSGGLLVSGAGYLGIGLYNTEGSGNYPVPGGLPDAMGSTGTNDNLDASGFAQNWQGYMAEVAYQGANQGDYILTRPQESTVTVNDDQDLVTYKSSGNSYPNPAIVGSEGPADSSLVLTADGTYTEVFTISLNGSASLAISNAIYSGPTATGTPLALYGGVATNATYLTSGFNAFAFGWYQKTGGQTNDVDISSVTVSGLSSAPSGPPPITSQPSPVLVATNGSCAFTVTSPGAQAYQWQRNGTNLINGGNISGATSDMLVISPASTTDQLSQADGYDVVITGAGEFTTNSITNSLTLINSTNLVWQNDDIGAPNVWDVDNSDNWEDTNGNTTIFNFGDPVTFNDVGYGGDVELDAPYLSAASVTVSANTYQYTFASTSTGGFAGPGSLIYNGAAEFYLDNANTYTGGTLISNAVAHLQLNNLAGLGSGPLTLAGGEMEIVPVGSGSSGIQSDIDVAGNFTILVDGTNSSYAGVFFGDFSGVSGMTLTLTNGDNATGGIYRIRAYGNNTVYDANLDLADPSILFAPYSSANSQTYNGIISGPGAIMEKGTITYLNGQNTYTGGTTPAQGAIGLGSSSSGSPGSLNYGPIGKGPLLLAPDSTTTLTGNGQIFASSGPASIGNAIQYPSGTNNLTLVVGGSASLTLAGPFTLQGNDGITTNTITSRNLEVTNTALTTISGVISDGGKNYGLNVLGNGLTNSIIGVLALSGSDTYTGPTTVTDATLLVNGQIGSGAVTVATNATLGGDGTIGGPVSILGTLAPGNQTIGTLTINNTLTCASGSTNFIEVNGPSSSDKVNATTIDFNGTLVATNIGAPLSSGNSFNVYHASTSYSGNFTTIAGSPGPGLVWSFNQTTGVLSVQTGSSIATNPTNITYSVSGGNLYLSWPADHLGWSLQVQTNSVRIGISNNWVTVPDSSTMDSTNFPINPANGTVFYRLMYQE